MKLHIFFTYFGILSLVGLSAVRGIRFHALFNSLAISIGRSNRNTGRREKTVATFDEYGILPQVEHAYTAVNKARQIIVFRTHNATIAAYRMHSYEQQPILYGSLGCKPLHTLTDSHLKILTADPNFEQQNCLLLTGISGDCRMVARYAKQVVVNHTVAYATPPTGRFIAEKLGALLQSHTGGSSRPLACHCFVISYASPGASLPLINNSTEPLTTASKVFNATGASNFSVSQLSSASTTAGAELCAGINIEGSIYEVSCEGNVWKVKAGAAGSNAEESKRVIREHYANGNHVGTGSTKSSNVTAAAAAAAAASSDATGGIHTGAPANNTPRWTGSSDDCKELVRRIMLAKQSSDDSSRSDATDSPLSFQYFEFPDVIL
mmetsp:Transcript_24737/g.41241  ORF Transcript_24737/g.41241 Transcript_24737/m.41241 type:complete len:379 (-) Transcript_24737:641-1777(-)